MVPDSLRLLLPSVAPVPVNLLKYPAVPEPVMPPPEPVQFPIDKQIYAVF